MKPEKSIGIRGVKEALRRRMRKTLQTLPAEDAAQTSLEICRRAVALPAFQAARALALFAPLATEPNIRPLIEEAWAHRRQVAFPLLSREADAPRLTWHRVNAWEELAISGPFGVHEPDPALCGRVAPADLDLIFVPGLAFDARGGRLGRGGGYYDAALAQFDAGTPRVGLMFAIQEVEEVPRQPHDQLLTGVITEAGLVSVAGSGVT